jgi:Trk-type K+ transport system membrane component
MNKPFRIRASFSRRLAPPRIFIPCQHEVFSKLRGAQRKLSVHSRIVILTTLILILSGALIFYALEKNPIIKGLPMQTQILVSFFQSITPRTTGFNTDQIQMIRAADFVIKDSDILVVIGREKDIRKME